MKIRPFQVEEWMNAYETGARYNIAETCVDSVSLDELFELTGEDKTKFWQDFGAKRLTYMNQSEINSSIISNQLSLF